MEEDEFKIGAVPTSRIIEVASLIVALTPDIPGNEDPSRQGGYLVLRDIYSGDPLLIERIEKCRPMDVVKYHELGLEKGGRLNMTMHQGHVSSHQSRNPKAGKFGEWGGAVIAGELIVSFSGLKELFDEAVVLVMAVKLGWLEMGKAQEIAEISGSIKFLQPLYDVVLQAESKATHI